MCLASAGHYPAPDLSLDFASPHDLGCENHRRFSALLGLLINALQPGLDMIKAEASESFIKAISHSLAVCLTSAALRHQGASLLIINTHLTKRRRWNDKISTWTDNRWDYAVDGSEGCGVYSWWTTVESALWVACSCYRPGVAVRAPGCQLVIMVRKEGRLSKMIPPPPSPSSLIPIFHCGSISCLSPTSPGVRGGPRQGRERINYSLGALATSHAFICTSN